MTENELEEFIQNAMSISFMYGSYSLFSTDYPGQITLRIRYENAADCLRFSKYVNTEFNGVNITAHFKQIQKDKVDFTLLIDKNPAIILSVKELSCRPDGIEMFFKKQPKNKPLFLFLAINKPPDTIENMVALMDAEMEAGTNQPISIHSWEGSLFGTSD